MWVISRRRLREFWERHPQAEVPLRAWFQVASRAEWQHLMDVRCDYPHADAVGRWTVFNIGGNDFRLVVEIVDATHKVFIPVRRDTSGVRQGTVEVMELSKETHERLLALFAQFPPVAIRTEEQLDAAEDVVDQLLDRERDEAEELYLDLLGTLIYAYEQANVEMPALTGLELIHALLVERDLNQRDLVRAGIFATASVASEVLAGKRSLTADQVRGLAAFFRLPADLFLHQTAAA